MRRLHYSSKIFLQDALTISLASVKRGDIEKIWGVKGGGSQVIRLRIKINTLLGSTVYKVPEDYFMAVTQDMSTAISSGNLNRILQHAAGTNSIPVSPHSVLLLLQTYYIILPLSLFRS